MLYIRGHCVKGQPLYIIVSASHKDDRYNYSGSIVLVILLVGLSCSASKDCYIQGVSQHQ